jgi:RNA-binding protein NOB1
MSQLRTLVLDSGAFFANDCHNTLAQLDVNIVTVPQVLQEIKDKASREALDSINFAIKVQVPSDHALNAVIEFAKLCGEFYELSATDLLVLALTYQLEVEAHGKTNIREKPLTVEDLVNKAKSKRKPKSKGINKATIKDSNLKEEEKKPDLGEQESWITPDNIDEHSDEVSLWNTATSKKHVKDIEWTNSTVACMTQDFGIQNVMGQMGLRLLSIHGKTLTKIRHWALGCFGCREITNQLHKEFCGACGGHTLIRVGVLVNSSTGEISYRWFNSKHGSLNSARRGVQYSIPKPKGGRGNNDLILREDELNAARKKYGNHDKARHSIENWTEKTTDFEDFGQKSYKSDIKYGHRKRNPNEVRPGTGNRKSRK